MPGGIHSEISQTSVFLTHYQEEEFHNAKPIPSGKRKSGKSHTVLYRGS